MNKDLRRIFNARWLSLMAVVLPRQPGKNYWKAAYW